VKYGGDKGKALARGIISQGSPSEIRQRQWVAFAQALFHRARRTMLGDDGNQIGAHSALLAASKQLAAS
jgi:hypothetical protein